MDLYGFSGLARAECEQRRALRLRPPEADLGDLVRLLRRGLATALSWFTRVRR